MEVDFTVGIFPHKKNPGRIQSERDFYCPLGLLTEQYGVLHMYWVYVEDSQVYNGGAS